MEHNGRIALIPAYNPDQKMLVVLEKLKEHDYTVIIVDDGSDSEFKTFFEQAESADLILHHHHNLGKGMALKTGLKYIRDNCAEPYTVVTVDADGQHGTSDVLTVSRAALSNPGTLIIGSRKLGKGAPFRSRSGNFITRLFLNTLTPARIYDTQSGLRAFSNELVPLLCEVGGERYEYEMQMLIDATLKNVPVKEVKIRTIYIDNNSSTHFKTVSDSKRLYKAIFKSVGKRKEK